MLKLLPDALKGAFRTPATRPHPVVPRQPTPGARGQLCNDMAECILCGLCARACPTQCLAVDKKAGQWRWDPMACIFCGSCVEACPTGSLTQDAAWRAPSSERESVTCQGTPGGKAHKKDNADADG